MDATCTESGLTEGKKCSVCGETLVEQEVVAALGHTEETIPAVAATCTESGLTEGKKCSVCGETLVEQEVVAALGHTEEIVPAVDATCTESGLTEGKKCTVCGEILVEQEVVAALGHTEEIVPAVAATCTESGLTEGKKCSVCGETLVEQEVVAALGHTEDPRWRGRRSRSWEFHRLRPPTGGPWEHCCRLRSTRTVRGSRSRRQSSGGRWGQPPHQSRHTPHSGSTTAEPQFPRNS